MRNEYLDERFCEHCNKDTEHTCIDSGHERDSSWDKQTCNECQWYAFGIDDKYTKPF